MSDMVDKKLVLALVFIGFLGFIILILMGSIIVSQQEKTQLNEDIDELTGKYDDSNKEKSAFNTKLLSANNDNTLLINEISTLKSEKDDINLELANLKIETEDINDENSYLLLRNSGLSNLSELYQDYSDELNEIIDKFENIPGTPAVSDMDYRLFGGPSGEATQLMIEYPELRVSGVVGTGSMHPGLSSQSMSIQTTSFNRNTLTPGQIVTYENNEGTGIIHRVHAINTTPTGICYVMKGDANFYLDGECVKPNQVKTLVLGILFRKPGQVYSCNTEQTPKVSSDYCPR